MRTHLGPETSKSRVWQSHVDSWLKSGLSQRSYCESCGLVLSTFQWWRRRLVASGVASQVKEIETVDLVPFPKALQVSADLNHSRRAAIVLCLGEYRLEIADDVQVQTLHRVIDVLEAR